MTRTIRIAGFGGQGVMLTGQLIAYAANKQGLYSLWVPTYGPETRGGTANCAIIISDKPIYSPVFSKSDDLLVFNEPSLNRFGDKVKTGGNLFYNSSLIKNKPVDKDYNVFGIPMNDIADDLEIPQVANMAMLGAYLKVLNVFEDQVIFDSLAYFLGDKKQSLFEVNKNALKLGAKALN